ncbi:hypothetical protein PBI_MALAGASYROSE_36 [Mycobacterium phage MalagasyRose]|uniref:Uncharacterized protein n=1 Tax=Mycobacterium phage MalagasyRose TaxID=2599870 RepID=A0A5J6TDI1_9CAUD|nr:hypothetical protein QEH39_gp52 [Mycobacterium phage MalagasyRose]QFG08886.1 hypothetical protein PBI_MALAGASYROSE_36 [Mycobacterium phage MalagasyRose]
MHAVPPMAAYAPDARYVMEVVVMPPGFWWGLLALPIGAAGVAAAVAAIAAAIWASAKFSVDEYKLWPHRTADYNRAPITAVVALAKSVHYLWVPGWHIAICRTTMPTVVDAADRERHHKVQRAVDDALREVRTDARG